MSDMSDKNESEAVEPRNMGPDEHESYGLARFSRVSGSPGRLFGSAIDQRSSGRRLVSSTGRRCEALRATADWAQGRWHERATGSLATVKG